MLRHNRHLLNAKVTLVDSFHVRSSNSRVYRMGEIGYTAAYECKTPRSYFPTITGQSLRARAMFKELQDGQLGHLFGYLRATDGNGKKGGSRDNFIMNPAVTFIFEHECVSRSARLISKANKAFEGIANVIKVRGMIPVDKSPPLPMDLQPSQVRSTFYVVSFHGDNVPTTFQEFLKINKLPEDTLGGLGQRGDPADCGAVKTIAWVQPRDYPKPEQFEEMMLEAKVATFRAQHHNGDMTGMLTDYVLYWTVVAGNWNDFILQALLKPMHIEMEFGDDIAGLQQAHEALEKTNAEIRAMGKQAEEAIVLSMKFSHFNY